MLMMKLFLFLIPIVIAISGCTESLPGDPEVTELKCNNLTNPLGTGEVPLFNWIVKSSVIGQKQTAYQIIVASDHRIIESGTGDIWESGKILSDQSAWVRYSGPDLIPGVKYFWRTRIWDKNGIASDWSEPASFVTGLFVCTDWGGARWIGYEEIPDSMKLIPGVHGNGNNLGDVAKKRSVVPQFRKEFFTEKRIKQALLFVSGLGQYELCLNGVKIGDRFLSPGWTDYSTTFLYNTFDVTGNLKKGKNVVGLIVGNGFFNINRERYRKLVINYGAPQMILKLEVEYTDGSKKTIVSDDTWKSVPSPVTYSGIYGGEDYDARLEIKGWDLPGFDDSGWTNAVVVNGPGGTPEPETDYPVRVMETLITKKISDAGNNLYVYDYEQNASGIIKLRIRGKTGQEVTMTPGELLGEDSLVDQRASGGPYYFKYILKGGDEEIWMPKFTYYGFRYVQVAGAVPVDYPNPEKLPVISELQFLHTRNSSPETGSFKCSNELFNSVYELINWSVKSNLASVATDCPHREKLGWLEQTHLMGNSIRYLYDIRNLYNKIIDDMIDAQLENGLVPDIAPEYVPFAGGFRDSPEWGSACILLPWDMYNWYGDMNAVKKAYPMMKKYLLYLERISKDHILYHGLGDWFDLGPETPGEAQLTPKSLTATSIYFYDNKIMAEMAALLGNTADYELYSRSAEEIRIAFNKKFFNERTKVYSTGSQTSFAMPLFFGMEDEKYREEAVKNLLDSITANGNALTAGDIGYRYLLRVLEQEGHSELISEMNSRNDIPGYGYQLAKGATSLTESWAALKYVSNNHMMLGHLMEWFYSGAGGIKQYFDENGECCIEISPDPVEKIKWAKTSYNSVFGKISCEWVNDVDGFSIRTEIPFGCNAFVIIPGNSNKKITVNGIPANTSKAVVYVKTKSGRSIFRIGSGEYTFVSPF
jgi:alpha-L-rhamnosidase